MRSKLVPSPSRVVLQAMNNFITCPCCSGHESVGAEAAHILKEAVALHLHRWREMLPDHVVCELENICNVIENTEQRAATVEEIEPICPTPDKAKYGSREHSMDNARRYKQHPYQCACGYWHLSKQSATQHGAKINSPPADADEFDAIDPLML